MTGANSHVPPEQSTQSMQTQMASGNAQDVIAVRAALEADYEILEELGRGGMAVVYRAREKALDREVAIKVLPASLAFDAEFVERFQREARTAGQLEHPHIVSIYRVGRADQVIFFVMKFLRGQSLASVLKQRGRLEVPEIRRILLETAGALGYAARRGVVHRDIKPDNILLDDEGRCVVTDFGIAKTASGPRTAAGTSMGTPRYMSPEHAQGTAVDGRSDIYSLGVVAYQCLAGVTPFNADDPFAILYKHINETLPRPSLTTPEEWELYAIVERMLAKEPKDRYQTADELIFALGGDVSAPRLADASGPIRKDQLTPTVILTQRIARTIRRYNVRNWRVWAAGTAIVVAAVVGISALMSGSRDNAVAAQPAPLVLPAAVVRDSSRAVATDTAVGARNVVPPMATNVAAVDSSQARKVATTPPAARATRPAGDVGSRCPKVAPKSPTLLVDSIQDQTLNTKLSVSYDVCGLPPGTAYTADVTVRKINQSRLKRMVGASVKPVTFSFPDVAATPRSRRRRTIDLAGLSPGTYSLDVGVLDAKGRKLDTSRRFQLVEKRP